MDDISPTPRPRSLPVVILDTVIRWLTIPLRPFRTGEFPTSQRIAIGIGAGIVMIGAVVLLVGVTWTPSGPSGPPHRAAANGGPTAGRPSESGIPLPSGSDSPPGASASDPFIPPNPSVSGAVPSGTSGPAANPPGARTEPLQARFSKVDGSQSLANYRATVTIRNPGQVPASRWTVTVTLPRETLNLSEVTGATASQNGNTWTLVPTSATASVAAGGSVSFSFQVNGAAVFDATPTACTIDGAPCSGLTT